MSAKLLYPPDFSESATSAELSSKTLSPVLVAKLQAMADKASAGAAAPAQQALAVLDALDAVVQTNRLLYAWEEVRRCKSLVKSFGDSTIKVQEAKGTVKVCAVRGAYNLSVCRGACCCCCCCCCCRVLLLLSVVLVECCC